MGEWVDSADDAVVDGVRPHFSNGTHSSESGAVLVMIAISIAMMLGFVAFVFDMGRLYIARAELQSAADTIAVVAAQELPDTFAAQDAATVYAEASDGGSGQILDSGDVVPGFWDPVSATFYPGGPNPNAVQITTKRAQDNGNPVEMVFASIFGFDTVDVGATAIAARGVVEADIIVLQDVTVSFQEEIDFAKDADKTMVDTFAAEQADTVQMGVVSFARDTWDNAPLTPLNTGQAAIKSAIDSMANCTNAGGAGGPCYGTDIAIGINRARDILENDGRPGVDKVIVLVSDGLPCIAEEPVSQWVTTGQQWATAAANSAGAAGINIFSITLYTPAGPNPGPCSASDITYNESLAKGVGFGVTTTDPVALSQILASVIDELPVRLVR